MKKMILTFLLVVFLSSISFASGGLVSGGGFGIVSGSHVYLLDLVEAGSEKTVAPTFASPRFQNVASRFDFLTRSEKLKLATKIQQITAIDPVLGSLVLKALQSYQWLFTNEDLRPLEPVDTPLASPAVPLAVRQSMVVYISKTNWLKMPPTHKVALLIHEALSGLLFPDVPGIWARQFIGAFFSHTERRPLLSTALLEQVGRAWPTRAYIQSVINPGARIPIIDLYYDDSPGQPLGTDLRLAPFA